MSLAVTAAVRPRADVDRGAGRAGDRHLGQRHGRARHHDRRPERRRRVADDPEPLHRRLLHVGRDNRRRGSPAPSPAAGGPRHAAPGSPAGRGSSGSASPGIRPARPRSSCRAAALCSACAIDCAGSTVTRAGIGRGARRRRRGDRRQVGIGSERPRAGSPASAARPGPIGRRAACAPRAPSARSRVAGGARGRGSRAPRAAGPSRRVIS